MLLKTTPDGRWQYGTDEYSTSAGELAKLSSPLGQQFRAEQATLEAAAKLDTTLIPFQAVSSAQKKLNSFNLMTVKVYQIIAKDPNGQKRIGGEWTDLSGGEAARNARFAQWWPEFIKDQNDSTRVLRLAETRTNPGNLNDKLVKERIQKTSAKLDNAVAKNSAAISISWLGVGLGAVYAWYLLSR
jgi:hypothetical protein